MLHIQALTSNGPLSIQESVCEILAAEGQLIKHKRSSVVQQRLSTVASDFKVTPVAEKNHGSKAKNTFNGISTSSSLPPKVSTNVLCVRHSIVEKQVQKLAIPWRVWALAPVREIHRSRKDWVQDWVSLRTKQRWPRKPNILGPSGSWIFICPS